jgi:hypothetical protein
MKNGTGAFLIPVSRQPAVLTRLLDPPGRVDNILIPTNKTLSNGIKLPSQ